MKESKKTKKKDKNNNEDENQDIYSKYHIIPPVSPIDTDEKREKIEQWKNHPDVQAHMNDRMTDDYIARWLISRQWDVKRSVDMFLESIDFREKNGMATICEEYPSDPAHDRIRDFWPGSHTGEFFTKDGWPVYYERYGIVDPKYLFSNIATPQELVRYHCYEQESREKLRMELYEKHGYTIGSVFVQDLGGLGWKHFKMLDVLKLVSGIDQLNFPEAVRKMYVINAPSIFSGCWKLIKPMVDKRTISKVCIMKNGYEEELKALIDEENIPIWAGGKNTEIGQSKTFSNQVTEDDDIPEENAIKLKIPPKEKVSIPIKVRVKNSTIGWRFTLEEFDIGYSLTFQRSAKTEPKVIIESARHEKNEGSYVAKHRGLYHIIFDNSYSWTKKKVIKYFTYIQKPDEYDVNAPTTARGDDENLDDNNAEDNVEDVDKDNDNDNKAEDS